MESEMSSSDVEYLWDLRQWPLIYLVGPCALAILCVVLRDVSSLPLLFGKSKVGTPPYPTIIFLAGKVTFDALSWDKLTILQVLPSPIKEKANPLTKNELKSMGVIEPLLNLDWATEEPRKIYKFSPKYFLTMGKSPCIPRNLDIDNFQVS